MDTKDTCFEVGNRCLLILMEERYLVTILDVTEGTVRVTFPTQDFPIDGMYVQIEFHDPGGYTAYESEVLVSPEGVGDGLLLKRPYEMTRTHHRSSWRAPVAFDVVVKGHVNPRKFTCPALNISVGGMLVATEAEFDDGATVELTFALPGGEPELMTAKVVHIMRSAEDESSTRLIGLEFVSPDPVIVRSISEFVWHRVRELHPESKAHSAGGSRSAK